VTGMNKSNASARADLARFESLGGRPPPRDARARALLSVAAPATGEPVRTRDGRTLLLRDIRPDDVDALRRGFADLTAEEVRLRFLHPLNDMPAAMAREFFADHRQRQHALAVAAQSFGNVQAEQTRFRQCLHVFGRPLRFRVHPRRVDGQHFDTDATRRVAKVRQVARHRHIHCAPALSLRSCPQDLPPPCGANISQAGPQYQGKR